MLGSSVCDFNMMLIVAYLHFAFIAYDCAADCTHNQVEVVVETVGDKEPDQRTDVTEWSWYNVSCAGESLLHLGDESIACIH